MHPGPRAKPVFDRSLQSAIVPLALSIGPKVFGALLLLTPGGAQAARVTGAIDVYEAAQTGRVLGHYRVRIVEVPEPALSRAAAVVFLQPVASLPIPPPKERPRIYHRHLALTPKAIGCHSTGSVEVVNEDKGPVTILYRAGGATTSSATATIGKGDKALIPCGDPGEMDVGVKEWPHERATVVVGLSGVMQLAGPDGKFDLEAPPGTYRLRVFANGAWIYDRPLEIPHDGPKGPAVVDVPIGRGRTVAASPDRPGNP